MIINTAIILRSSIEEFRFMVFLSVIFIFLRINPRITKAKHRITRNLANHDMIAVRQGNFAKKIQAESGQVERKQPFELPVDCTIRYKGKTRLELKR